MSIPRYRIGNDLTVLWAINNKDGSPYDLSQKEVRLFVTHPRDRVEVEAVVETLPDGEVNNVIRWDFSGLDQRVLGRYMLTVEIYTSENKKLIRKDISEAFELVSRSEMENDEDGDAVMDGGELYLSSKLDIYRFGIPKIQIGANGNWYIDNVDTNVSAIGGGKGLVYEIYTHEDFEKGFIPDSVIDTFNAYAVASLAKRLKVLEAKDYLQIRNMTDVLLLGELKNGQILVWDGTRWTNREVAVQPGGGSGTSEEIKSLLKLLDWFELDPETNLIRANHGFYSVGPITALGKAGDKEFPYAVSQLLKLKDVMLSDPKEGDALVYDSLSGTWINRAIEGGTGGPGISVGAVMEEDVKADVAVGFVSKGKTLAKGLTLTQVMQQIFSQAVTLTKPSVSLSGYPTSAKEVGETILLNLSSNYTDGKFKNTKDGTINAGCEKLATTYSLDEDVISVPHTLEATYPKVHSLKVTQQYGASTAVVTSAAGEVIDISIPADIATAEASFVVGYRAFWGYMTDLDAESITSASVRALEHADTIINPSHTVTTLLSKEHDIPGGEDLIIAIPEGYKLNEVLDGVTSRDFSATFSRKTITITCGGNTTKAYNVYRYDNLNDDPMPINKITIKKEA